MISSLPRKSVECPSCGASGLREFYDLPQIPAHSVLLMPTQERALTYPRRDLRLGFCPACGFVTNVLFDRTAHEYSTQCEESQGCSPTFNAFARRLARRWVEQYDLRGRTVLEIGCGKGEFLALLVELGMSHGIGIDPAYIPGRLETSAADRLEFIQDLYSERYTHLRADVVCCRHTLEHIAPTREFMEMIRGTLGERHDTLVLFELPDVLRVLREAAFWDIYYEHCSYFTLGSLARLFRLTRFELLELCVDYDDQYLLLVARPTAAPTQPALPAEDDLAQVRQEVEAFPDRCARLREHWRSTLGGLHREGQCVVGWGGGSKAVAFLTTLGLKEEIQCVVDINPHKHGKFIPGTGHAVVGPESLRQVRPDCVVLMNPIYEKEVRATLNRMDLDPRIIPV